MPNSIKYSTTGDTLSLRKGNLYFGTGDVGKGPSSVTQHYNGVTPNGGGYTIYFYDPSQPNNIGFDPVSSDPALVEYTNRMFGTTFTGATQCLTWYSTQPNRSCVNKDYESIVTNGLALNLDAGFLPSYPTSGTTWYDLSYSGNNGTLTNGPTYSSLDGGSIVFDGVNDTVSFPAITLGSTYTITQTLVASASNNNIGYMPIGGGIVSSGSTYTGYVWFTTNPAGSTTSIVFNQNGETGGFSFTLPTPLPQYTLFQYTLVKNSSTANFYINGTLLTTQSVSSGTNFTVRNLGWSYSSYYMNRNLYSTQIYNRALSAAEILKNYNAGLARFNTSNVVKSNLLLNLDSSNTVSYPTTGTTWTDLSGNGYNGTLTNGPTFNSTSKSIVFDGVNDYVNCGNSVGNFGSSNFTINFLFKTTEQTYPATFIAKSIGDSPTINYGWLVNNGDNGTNLGFAVANTNSGWGSSGSYIIQTSGTSINNGIWQMATIVGDKSQSNVSIYINGTLQSLKSYLTTTAALSTVGNVTNTQNLTIGSESDIVVSPFPIDASIQLVRLYNKALSQSEVLQNFYGGPIVTNGLVMYLDAGNLVSYSGAGTTWYDLTASGNTGTLINGPSYGTTNGPAISFDGTNDYLNTTYNIEAATSSNLQTFCSWMYGTTINSTFFGSGADNTGKFHLILQYSSTTQLFFGESYYGGGAGPTDQNNYATVSPNSTWNYACIVKTAPSTFDVYFNGVKVISGASKAATSSATFSLGRLWSGWYRPSIIGSVQIYNRSLTADEVAQNFNAQKSRFGL